MTNHWRDIKHADVILINGANPAEAHPVGFQWFMKAKLDPKRGIGSGGGAKIIHLDPRFTRTSAVADIYGRIRTGTDTAFFGGLINYVLEKNLIHHEYVRHYTNASFLLKEGYEFHEGLFSGYDPAKRSYDTSTWTYEGDATAQAGFTSAGGLVTDREGEVLPVGPPRPTLVVAGCDPALPLLAAPLAALDPPVGFTWWACSSAEALRLAEAGLVHVAGAHLRGRAGEYNTGPACERLRHDGAEVLRFASWREGLVLRPDQAGKIGGLSDAARYGLRLVNREPGAEARSVLDREAARVGIAPEGMPGYRTKVTGHLQVAAAIAAGLADTGVASEPAALAYGLAFLPLTAERFDLVIPAWQAGSREVQALRRVLASAWLQTQLDSLPGCDPSRCGDRVAAW